MNIVHPHDKIKVERLTTPIPEIPKGRRDQMRERVLEAAEAVISTKGLAGLKARDIAARAGCALGAIYTVFEDLDELILGVNQRTLARLEAALAAPNGRGWRSRVTAARPRLSRLCARRGAALAGTVRASPAARKAASGLVRAGSRPLVRSRRGAARLLARRMKSRRLENFAPARCFRRCMAWSFWASKRNSRHLLGNARGAVERVRRDDGSRLEGKSRRAVLSRGSRPEIAEPRIARAIRDGSP